MRGVSRAYSAEAASHHTIMSLSSRRKYDIFIIMEKTMPILDIKAGDRLELKKKHPCGSVMFTVVRSGSDVRIICDGCGRDMTLPREKMEKAVKRLIRKAVEVDE